MPQKELSVATINEMEDGRIAAEFNRELSALAKDCYSRPGDKRPRQVTLKVTIKPIMDRDGRCDSVKLTADVSSKMPDLRSPEYVGMLKPSGVIQIQTTKGLHAEPNQLSLEDEAARRKGDPPNSGPAR
jgi:hypothetical protein